MLPGGCNHLAELLRRTSTARISACLTYTYTTAKTNIWRQFVPTVQRTQALPGVAGALPVIGPGKVIRKNLLRLKYKCTGSGQISGIAMQVKPKRRMSATQIEKKSQRDRDRIQIFQQKKKAEELV